MARCKTARALLAAVTVFTAQMGGHADIYRWGTDTVIPGTEGIWPGPGVELSG